MEKKLSQEKFNVGISASPQIIVLIDKESLIHHRTFTSTYE